LRRFIRIVKDQYTRNIKTFSILNVQFAKKANQPVGQEDYSTFPTNNIFIVTIVQSLGGLLIGLKKSLAGRFLRSLRRIMKKKELYIPKK
jgi:hypothetical protein